MKYFTVGMRHSGLTWILETDSFIFIYLIPLILSFVSFNADFQMEYVNNLILQHWS